jgi:HPt (histidine-containing phosphotransfer) domain-containing protein
MSLSRIYSQLVDDPDYAELVTEFVSHVPDRIKSIRAAMAQNDTRSLCTLIHQLKGACGSYGFHELTPLASHLEGELRSGASVESQFDALEAFMETCLRMTADPE